MSTSRVVVGVDGSTDSARALRWAGEYAQQTGAMIEAIGVYELPVMLGPTAMAGFQDGHALEEKARETVASTVTDVLGADAPVTQRVERGHPADVLIAASEGANMLVVGSRGRGGFSGLMLGSVSQHCVTHGRCPVLVMPHAGA